MYDIIFDFSSSPAGGGLRRLEAYAEYFSQSHLKTHFFIHASARNRDRIQQLIPATLVQKSFASKALVNNDYLKEIDFKAKWLFSYGIPTKRSKAEQNWLHVSNVLPFFIFHATSTPGLFFKMSILRQQFKANFRNNDIVSAESNFSIKMYINVTGWIGDTLILRNGIYKEDPVLEYKQPYAIAVGTHSYKRIDLTYKIFTGLKEDLGLKKLLIVGDSKLIPGSIRSAIDVDIRNFLPEAELQSCLKRASYFISTSEVENSSCAVLEGLRLTKTAILSDIPSHQEMFREDSVQSFQHQGADYLIVNQSDVRSDVMVDWDIEIEKMLLRMGLS